MLYANMLSIAKTVLSSEDAKIINETIFFGSTGQIIFSAVDCSGTVHEIHITGDKKIHVTRFCAPLNQVCVSDWVDISEDSIPELEPLGYTINTYEVVQSEHTAY